MYVCHSLRLALLLRSRYSIAVELFNHVARVLCSVKPVSLVTVESVES